MIFRSFVVLLASMCMTPMVHATEVNKLHRAGICDLGEGKKERIEVLKGRPVYDMHVFYLKEPNVSKPQLIFGGKENESKGASVIIRCAGDGERVMILFGEFFGSAYPKGFVIRFNAHTELFERIDFAEHSFPEWVYLNEREMKVVLYNHGRETDKKFIVYQFIAGEGQVKDVFYLDTIPSSIGYKVISVQH